MAQSRNFYPWTEDDRESPLIRLVVGLPTQAVGRNPAAIYSPDMPLGRGAWTYFDYLDLDGGRIRSAPVRAGMAEGTLAKLDATTPTEQELRELLNALERVFGFDVAIEFTVRDGAPGGRVSVLQVRPLESHESNVVVEVPTVGPESVLVSSCVACGNRLIRDLDYVVYADPPALTEAMGTAVRRELADVNRELREDRYILIGRGWWGTRLTGKGIPVDFHEICHASALVELLDPDQDRSLGGHLLTNILAESIPLLSVCPGSDDAIDREWLRSEPAIPSHKLVRVIIAPPGLTVAVDGRTGRGLVYFEEGVAR
jgi:hypothetical protein